MAATRSASVSNRDRERMADDLFALGLYATSNDVRAYRAKLTDGTAHVRNYCLPNVERGIDRLKARPETPTPGTVGASMLPNAEKRRDELRRFLSDWAPYDFRGRAA